MCPLVAGWSSQMWWRPCGQLLSRLAVLKLLQHRRGIKDHGCEGVARTAAVPLNDLFLGVAGVVEQLDCVVVGVREVDRHCRSVVEALSGIDVFPREPRMRLEQVPQSRILEREVIQ